MLSTYRPTFAHEALPDLVGLRATPWFALGLVLGSCALLRAAGAWSSRRSAGTSWSSGFGQLGAIRAGLHETAWSITMLEWLADRGRDRRCTQVVAPGARARAAGCAVRGRSRRPAGL